jgi:hypothetical protein
VNHTFVKDGPNSVCHAYYRLQQYPVDGFAEERWSETALILSPIEKRFFSKRPFFGSSRRERKIEVVSGGQSGRAGPQSRVYKWFSSIPVL